MKEISFFRRIFPLLVVLCTFLVSVPVSAQSEVTYYDPISEIDLGVDALTLEVGETYVFSLTHVPEETPNVFLNWYADDMTVTVDPEEHSVTALAAGTTRILVESNAGFAFDFCDITVVGEGQSEGKAGNQMLTLSDESRNKIEAKTVLNFLAFMENANFSDEMIEKFGSRMFNVTAEVAPGTVSEESQRALDLGFENAEELPSFNAVSLFGTFLQILEFVEDNSNLIRLFEFAPVNIPDSITEMNDALAAKAMNLGSNVEGVTHVSVAHNNGFTGKGTVVAIIDTGLNKSHKQFNGRVIEEICAAKTGWESYMPVCVAGSAEPSLSMAPALHNHGSHVAGIAAGLDGIAPEAEIIAINISVEQCINGYCTETLYYSPWEVSQKLVQLQNVYKVSGNKQIVAANYSLGDGLDHKGTCDAQSKNYYSAFEVLRKNDILPVVCTHNQGYDGAISDPACLSNAFSVGALYHLNDSNGDLLIAPYSNHSRFVDILAPGTYLRSALYAWQENRNATCDDGNDVNGRINCIGEDSGTSMATPVVTGAFALLKQAYPSASASQLEKMIISMSNIKTANHRLAGSVWNPNKLFNPEKYFDYDIPVLTFDNILDLTIPDPAPEPGPEPQPDQDEIIMYPVENWQEQLKLPSTGIIASVLPEKPVDLNYKNLNWNVQIPTISVSADIVEVPFRDDEYAVTWLGDKAGLLAGFPMPGRGTTVIAGHNHLNAEEAGPFAMLQFVKEGDRIFIQSPDNSNTTYIVYANEKIEETDFAAFERIAGARKNAVVFITCEDERVDGGYANRRIVAAMPE